ncbi:hypothetical protein KK062_27080 [Fulvivirgaceae bacterium PWU5]|uniref:Uncharacterized protein n=1 Tax=Dawidia cretensis TaxID=2782350 RepID=A0AAP2E2N7_9BACT|nr:DUF6520 family protein [Dawidia cretensis]MBT1711936.1 hypothetical protein [Dawidia cretensis]
MKKTRVILTAAAFTVAAFGGVVANNLLVKTAYANVSGTITPVTVADNCVKAAGTLCQVEIEEVTYPVYINQAEATTNLPANRLRHP